MAALNGWIGAAKIALLLGFACLALVGPATFAQAKDPLIGTWILDLGTSSFVLDNPPQKRVILITAKDEAIRFVIRTTASGGLDNGMVSESEFTAKYDGKDNEISESILDTVSLKKIDANTIERSGKIRWAVVETSTMKISPDRKTLTITTKGSVGGNDYSSVQVYNKQ